MMKFNDLDDAMTMFKYIAASSPAGYEEEHPEGSPLTAGQDIGGTFYDEGMGSDAYDPEAKRVLIIVSGADEDGIEGSSSDVNPDAQPLLEQDKDQTLEEILDEGLGLRGSLHKSLNAMECCDGILPNKYHIGDLIRMAACNGNCKCDCEPKCPSVIFIVKNCDGDMITASKPTDCKCDQAIAHEGKWPEFYFNQNEIEPLGEPLDTIDMLKNIIRFNDAKVMDEGSLTGGKIIDPDTFKAHQANAAHNQLDVKLNDVWEDMFGKSLSDCVSGKKCEDSEKATLKDVINGNVGAEKHDSTNKPVIKMTFGTSLNEGVEKVLHGNIFDY